MIVIDCATDTITLDIPTCGGQVHSAQVFKPNGPIQDVSFSQTPDGKVALTKWPSPPEYPAGVYRLSVQTDCGCYDAPVYLNCPAPGVASSRSGAPIATLPFVSCLARHLDATTSQGEAVTLHPAPTGTVSLASPPPAHGTATTDGTALTYTPEDGFTGVDSFGYAVTDANGDSTEAMVTVTARAVS